MGLISAFSIPVILRDFSSKDNAPLGCGDGDSWPMAREMCKWDNIGEEESIPRVYTPAHTTKLNTRTRIPRLRQESIFSAGPACFFPGRPELSRYNADSYSKSKEESIMVLKRNYPAAVVIALVAAMACPAEFQVNTRTSSNQANPVIAADASGNFVVVWNSYFSGRSNEIFGRRFGPDASPIGSEFQINTTTPGNQKEPSVVTDALGNFVVFWYGPGVSEEDIFGRRFDSYGQPLSDEFGVNSHTESRQQVPKAAMNAAGACAVVWQSDKLGTKPYAYTVSCQLYDGNGLVVGQEFEANLLPGCRYPDVAMDDNGNFAIVWLHDNSPNSIMARLYNADGTARTDSFEVSTIGFNSITRPSIAMDWSGGFVVAWDGDPERASDDDIHARCYTFDGVAMGEQFVVNTTLAGTQRNPRVAMNDQREFVIVWDSKIDPDINERNIFGQRYDGLGRPIGDEFGINTYAADDQKYPAVAMKDNGEFLTVWQSKGQDGSGYGIFGETGRIASSADFTGDGFVDFRDYCFLAEEWRKSEKLLTADLIDDNKINEQDLAEFCYQWLTSGK